MSDVQIEKRPGSPKRDHMDLPDVKWRSGLPDYNLVNSKYLKERSKLHPEGSLEKIVENLVKSWEMESTHKVDEKDWRTVDKDKFFISTNGGRKFNLQDNIELGNYNMLMDGIPLYDSGALSNEDSHKLFKATFKSGFAWEVLEVHSGPPVVSFTWRHWGTWEGSYKGVPPTGETLELFGSAVVHVTDKLKIESIEVFYDPNPMIAKLSDFKGSRCPMQTRF